PTSYSYHLAALKHEGAIISRITATAELPHTQRPLTRNPHKPEHTPGCSSRGSAAEVADGMVTAALATQTGGSTIRPAAYCGIVGFKPTFGLINTAGVKPIALSLDTFELMARSVAYIELFLHVLVPPNL